MSEQKKNAPNVVDIYLAEPRGFCAGVRRAVSLVEESLKKYGAPVFVRHEIVHNRHVIQELESKGFCKSKKSGTWYYQYSAFE